MPHFDIIRRSEPQKSCRVATVMGTYDLQQRNVEEHFIGDIDLPEKWSIGLIVGRSGTGKTTIARELFGEQLIDGFDWSAQSVVDDMPKSCSMDEIEKMFYAVGFGSVPSWLKPFSVLSNGEKMRVELARALLERDFVVFDEFTSVVDRTVAATASAAIHKAIHRTGKKFVAVTCHYDILEWLQPDWVFDTNDMHGFFTTARAQKSGLKFGSAGEKNGRSLGVITI
jgi:ABC-type ATPase with predicted acetyltransferase domain